MYLWIIILVISLLAFVIAEDEKFWASLAFGVMSFLMLCLVSIAVGTHLDGNIKQEKSYPIVSIKRLDGELLQEKPLASIQISDGDVVKVVLLPLNSISFSKGDEAAVVETMFPKEGWTSRWCLWERSAKDEPTVLSRVAKIPTGFQWTNE